MIGDIPFSVLSASGLLSLTVLLLLMGRIVPRSTLRDKMEDARRWQAAYETERTAGGISTAQVQELLEAARTTHAIIVAMAEASERIKSGEPDETTET